MEYKAGKLKRFFVSPMFVEGNNCMLSKQESHHLVHVMRLHEGDRCELIDGQGMLYTGEVASIAVNGNVCVTIHDTRIEYSFQTVDITLAQALPQKRKFDSIVEKATELGVARIIPLVTERTEVVVSAKKKEHLVERWETIAIQAAKQSMQSYVPDIYMPISFAKILPQFKNYDRVLLFVVGDVPMLRDVCGSIQTKEHERHSLLILIGPEGGFSPSEIDAALADGATACSLGRTVLKTDTATVASISVVQSMFQ